MVVGTRRTHYFNSREADTSYKRYCLCLILIVFSTFSHFQSSDSLLNQSFKGRSSHAVILSILRVGVVQRLGGDFPGDGIVVSPLPQSLKHSSSEVDETLVQSQPENQTKVLLFSQLTDINPLDCLLRLASLTGYFPTSIVP